MYEQWFKMYVAGNSKSCQNDVQDDKHSDDERYSIFKQRPIHFLQFLVSLACVCSQTITW